MTDGIAGRRTKLYRLLGTCVVLLLMMGGATPASACFGDLIESVHFHGAAPDFGIPPRRAMLSWRGEHDDRPSEGWGGGDKRGIELIPAQEDTQAEHLQKMAERQSRLEALEDAGKWREARQEWSHFAAQTGWTGLLRDRVECLTQIERMRPPSAGLLAAYRHYRTGLDADEREERGAAQEAFAQVFRDPSAGFLRGMASYQLASLAWEWLDFPRAISLYQQTLRDFPQSARREEALIMLPAVGCTCVESSESSVDLPEPDSPTTASTSPG